MDEAATAAVPRPMTALAQLDKPSAKNKRTINFVKNSAGFFSSMGVVLITKFL